MDCVDCQFYIRIAAVIFMPLSALGVTIVLWVLYQEARDRFLVFAYDRKKRIRKKKAKALRAKKEQIMLEIQIKQLSKTRENDKNDEQEHA